VAINRSIYVDVHILCYLVGTTTFARTTTVPVGRGKVFVASVTNMLFYNAVAEMYLAVAIVCFQR